MHVLITGGAGFIAFHLASELLKEGEDLTLVDNFNDFYDPRLKRLNVTDLRAIGPVDIREVDILDREGLHRAVEESRPDAIVHLAAWAGVRPSLEKPSLYSEVNVTGTVNLLELARRFSVPCFIFGSSSSVYGGNIKVPFSEADPVDRPVSPYAATKKAGELLCHSYSHNFSMNITCLRFFTVYGPRQRPEMAIHRFAQLMWEGKEIPVFGDGHSRRDYTYVDDIVSGIRAALKLNPRYGVFNLGESATITLLDLIRELEEALSLKARLRYLPHQPGDMLITYADITRSREVLGYDPKVSIHDGIRRFAHWFLENKSRIRG